ncbi:MAG TPA: helix-turn-helix transcriptional regulator [Clostridiaceae bacterium]|nr:helix-turn-helix transcriptional regulator [Clostridiaceae bacterium]
MGFGEFVKRIPEIIHNRTKSFITDDIAIFKPDAYVVNRKLCIEDYHFIIFHSTPPPAKIDNKELQFKKGSLISLEPGTEMTVFGLDNDKPCQYISINVKKDFMQKVANEALGKSDFRFSRCENSYSWQLLWAIKSFEYELSNYSQRFPFMIENLASQIAFLLLRDSLPEYGKLAANRRYENYLSQAIEYMRTYYSSSITIEDISKYIYLSPSHFKRVFKTETGITPYRFLLKVRIEKAKQVLLDEDYSFDEVARLCGFANAGHLSSVLKKSEGLTPSEYRRGDV